MYNAFIEVFMDYWNREVNFYEKENCLIRKYKNSSRFLGYAKGQLQGKYQILSFDIKDSKKLYAAGKEEEKNTKVKTIMNAVVADILELEKKIGKPVLHIHNKEDQVANKKLVLIKDQFEKHSLTNEELPNPFFGFGDEISFFIHKDSVKPEVIFNLFEKHAKVHSPDYSYYFNSICYETDNTKNCMKEYWQQFAWGALSLMLKDDCNMIYAKDQELEK